MQLLAQTGISYSDEHLTGDFVQWLVDSARRPAVGEVVMAEVPPGPADLESTLRAAWEDMSQDPEFVAEAQRRNYGPDQALADLQRGLEAPVTTAVDRAAAEMLTLDYRVAEEDDAFVHRVNETEILRIPKAAELAGTVSDTAKVTLYAVFVVIDVLTVVAAAAGVYITQAKEALSKVMAKPLQRFLAWIGANAAKAGQLQRLKEAGDKVGIIVRVLAWLRGTVNVKDVLGAFFSSMRWWEKAVVVIQLLASIAMIVATVGSTLAAKIVQLVAAVAILIGDVVLLVGALQHRQAAT